MESVVGFHPVREALRARRRKLRRLRYRADLRQGALDELLALARTAGVPAEAAAPSAFQQGAVAGLRHQGVWLEAGPLPVLGLEELLEVTDPEPRGPRHIVVLDGVEDPQNVGAVARVAEASGCHGLVLSLRRAPPLGPAVSRASAGAIEHLPVARVPNLGRALRLLRDEGFWVLGADAREGEDLYATEDAVWQGELALVFGAEDRGLRPGVARLLDHRLRIPLAGRVASLNVAAAAAVLLFEARRRRSPPGG
jgi:23S rRNA (guanosine2251-2'-O)-methyltransferase